MDKHTHPYQYQPLKRDGTIRILTLDPGRHDDPLTGILETVPTDTPGVYEALSYVWADPGPPNIAYEILIRNHDTEDDREGTLVLKGGSIFAALRQLRLPNRPRRMWADQCCINQDDPMERSQQVQYMNRIYGSASHVLVWLGLDDKNEAGAAFSIIHKLDQVLPHRRSSLRHGRFVSLTSQAVTPGTMALVQKQLSDNQKALQALADRPWFKRGWIVQEIGTSAPATMTWGSAAIDWDLLASVCERLKPYHTLREQLSISSSNISYLHRRFVAEAVDKTTHHANRFNFVYELQRARYLQFSDDRDRVFAFLGHFSAQSRSERYGLGGPVNFLADYTKSLEQTYVDVAKTIVETNPAAACMLFVSVQHRPRGDIPSNRYDAGVIQRSLPSWVPDWRWSGGIILGEPICPHYAHGTSTTDLEIRELNDELTLRIHGLETEVVEACSRPLGSSDFYVNKSFNKNTTRPTTKVEQLWHDIAGRTDGFSLGGEKYPNGDTSFFAFMQTLSNGCVQAAGHACVPYGEVPDEEWLRKAAKYIVDVTTGTVGVDVPREDSQTLVAEDIQKAAEELDDDGEHNNWSRWATSAADGRVFARTSKGYYMLGPAALETGDVVCVLYGCKVPFCLRPHVSSGGVVRYLLVGECYLHGFMKGEALEMVSQGKLDKKVFQIV